MKLWLRLLQPGDWLLLAALGLAVGWSFWRFWPGAFGDRAVVRLEGQVVAELSLAAPTTLRVDGPLGVTVIGIEAGRARVISDPGPRQYCVRQGWLSRAGEIAICAPNRVSLGITGRNRAYDSLAY